MAAVWQDIQQWLRCRTSRDAVESGLFWFSHPIGALCGIARRKDLIELWSMWSQDDDFRQPRSRQICHLQKSDSEAIEEHIDLTSSQEALQISCNILEDRLHEPCGCISSHTNFPW